MYLSIRDAMFEPFDTPLDGVKHLNVRSVEIELTRAFEVPAMDSREKITLKDHQAVAEYRKHLDSMGIHGCSFLTACDFSVGDPVENAQWISRALEYADIMGMKNIRIDSYMSREMELDFGERVRIFAEGLKGALDGADTDNVEMGIENHGFQGNNLTFLLLVFKQVGSERLGMTMDTGNFYWRGYPLSEVYGILELLAPYTKHTHLKNINYPADTREKIREGGWEYVQYVSPIEEGDIDHGRVIKLLHSFGYQGDICIEDESLMKFSNNDEKIKVLERDVAHVQACINAALQ